MADSSTNFVGVGWSFPMRFDARTGGVKKDQGTTYPHQVARVSAAVGFRLRLRRGSLYYQRRLGCRVHRLLFRPNTENLQSRVIYEVLLALEDPNWGEHRASFDRIVPEALPQSSRIDCLIDYTLRQSNEQGSFVWPFYLTPADQLGAQQQAE